MRLPHGIRRRLTLSLLLVFVLGLGAVAAFSHVEMRWAEERLRQRALETHAREFLAGLSVSGDGRVAIALLPDWEEPYRQPGAAFAFTLYDATGRPVLLSPNLARPLPLLELPPREVYGRMRALDADERVALPARAPDGHTLIVARGPIDQETLAAVFLDEALEFLAVFLLFAAAAFALIWLIVGWSLRPLVEAAREAAAVGPANPSGRISAEGLPTEIRPLVGAVNGALERLDRAYVAQKRLTADAAHEL
ncbi:MAG TPA: hypothetical protein VF606_11870, partial [Geminicoccaceae bacterium]